MDIYIAIVTRIWVFLIDFCRGMKTCVKLILRNNEASSVSTLSVYSLLNHMRAWVTRQYEEIKMSLNRTTVRLPGTVSPIETKPVPPGISRVGTFAWDIFINQLLWLPIIELIALQKPYCLWLLRANGKGCISPNSPISPWIQVICLQDCLYYW